MLSRTKKKYSFWAMMWYELKFSFKYCPVLMLSEIILSTLHGISLVVVTYMTQYFFDTVVDVVNGNTSLSMAYYTAFALGAIFILNQVISGVECFSLEVLTNKLMGYAKLKLYKKASRLSAELFESTAFLDELNKAAQGAEFYFMPLFPLIGISTYYLAFFLGIGAYVFHLRPILALSIIFVFIPSLVGQFMKTYLYTKLVDASVQDRRRFEYFEQCLCGKEYLKETRALNATSYFRRLYANTLDILAKKIWHTNLKAKRLEAISKIITLIGYLGILLLLVDSLVKGFITVGAFAAVFVTIGRLFFTMNEAVETIGGATQNVGLVQNYMKFLDYEEEQKEEKPVTFNQDIVLKNVSYTYKGADKETLHNINLTIKKGEKIAIVGENGSGKTTLVRLITGLFQPTSGSVQFDGVDIRNVDYRCVLKNISVVFQNFQKYKMTLRENIAISSEEQVKDDVLEKLLKQLGLDVSKKVFPDGFDTMLSREFGGVDLSGGQWQRIAIARGMKRKHNLVVLDEPTAAIDPIEETRLFNIFSKITESATSLIVTHRLGSTKLADRIIVVDQGEIIESGSHSELMKNRGKYYNMYQAQSEWYVK